MIFLGLDHRGCSKGFTLLELLVVIAIIAILSAILIFILNPAEILRKGRDSQRMADLDTLNRTLSFYITDRAIASKNIILASGGSQPCRNPHTSVNPVTVLAAYSGDGNTLTSNLTSDPGLATWGNAELTCSGGPTTFLTTHFAQDSSAINGTGWVQGPDFGGMSSGSPIAVLPRDPAFSVSNLSDPTESDFLYLYSCISCATPGEFFGYELNANMESKTFRSGGSDDKESTDGGDNINLFETGSKLNILTSP